MISGPMLRELRMSKGLSLREVARGGKYNHGHLSKVERGDPDRPVTPMVQSMYEQACGVSLPEGLSGLRPGQLTDGLRRQFAGRVAAVAAGAVAEGMADGNWADPYRMHAFLRNRKVPEAPVDQAGLSVLAQVTDPLAGLDGVVAGQAAGLLLPWVVDLLAGLDDDKLDAGLRVVIAYLALRAGQAAVELDGHETARGLYLVALYHARQADEPDLSTRVMASIAEQHLGLAHYRDAVNTCRLGEVDDLVSEATRQRLAAIRTRVAEQERRVDDAVRDVVGEGGGG